MGNRRQKRREIEVPVSGRKAASAIQVGRRLGGVRANTLGLALRRAGIEKGVWDVLSYRELRLLCAELIVLLGRSKGRAKQG